MSVLVVKTWPSWYALYRKCLGSERKVVFCVRNIEEKSEKATTLLEEHVTRCFRSSSQGFIMTKERLKEVLAVRVDESTVWSKQTL